jgi:hypothetical protein
MSEDFYHLADFHRIPVVHRRSSFFPNRPIERINQFLMEAADSCLGVKHGQAPWMPQVCPHQLASVDCFLQYAIERRYGDPRSEDMRTTHNPGDLKPLTLTGLELNYLVSGIDPIRTAKAIYSVHDIRIPTNLFSFDLLHELKGGERKTVPLRLSTMRRAAIIGHFLSPIGIAFQDTAREGRDRTSSWSTHDERSGPDGPLP